MAIITPYAAQRRRLKQQLTEVTVGKKVYNFSKFVLSIDQSQGREFPLVFITTVRSSRGRFISDYRRINVALTRAQHGMVIFGNQKTLKEDKMWNYMLKYHKYQVYDGVQHAVNNLRQ